MKFLNRHAEMRQLSALAVRGGLGVVWGRRRIGKTRLLLEWARGSDGIYHVADASAGSLQRQFFAAALAPRLPGFADVIDPSWATVFARLGRALRAEKAWRGPLIIDELPYLVATAPELPSILQRFVDHELRASGRALVVCGSSQQMMHDAVLRADAPLYGRADVLLDLRALPAGHIGRALGLRSARACVEAYAAWGGVPRYWELAAPFRDTAAAVAALVLDPRGPLCDEPIRLLRDEQPSATALRPVLDAIGGGAHRVAEIATKLAQPSSSLARPLARLCALGMVTREQPFGTTERAAKRSLYVLSEPLLRLWFTTVAPQRGVLAQATGAQRRALLARAWPHQVAAVWERLCRLVTPHLGYLPAQRFWHGQGHEWDVVARAADGSGLLVGEAKWTRSAPSPRFVRAAAEALVRAGPPPVAHGATEKPRYVLFLPSKASGMRLPAGVEIVDAATVLAHLIDPAE